MRINSIHGCADAYRRTISSVPSVEPSLTTTHLAGWTVCATTDFSVSSMNCASLRAGVMRTYVGRVGMASSPWLKPRLDFRRVLCARRGTDDGEALQHCLGLLRFGSASAFSNLSCGR